VEKERGEKGKREKQFFIKSITPERERYWFPFGAFGGEIESVYIAKRRERGTRLI